MFLTLFKAFISFIYNVYRLIYLNRLERDYEGSRGIY